MQRPFWAKQRRSWMESDRKLAKLQRSSEERTCISFTELSHRVGFQESVLYKVKKKKKGWKAVKLQNRSAVHHHLHEWAYQSFKSWLIARLSLPCDAAVQNADGVQEVITCGRSSLTSSHDADVLRCFLIDLNGQALLSSTDNCCSERRRMQEAVRKIRVGIKIALHCLFAVGRSRVGKCLCVCSNHFVKLALCGPVYVTLQIINNIHK